MKNLFLILILAVVVIAFFSCAPVVVQNNQASASKRLTLSEFSERVRNQSDFPLYKERLDSLQFYNGPVPIILQRSIVEKRKKIIDGQLVSYFEEIKYSDTIKAYTKGVMIPFSDKKNKNDFPKICVTFEKADTLNLVFAPNDMGIYVLRGNHGQNELYYGTRLFKIISGGDGMGKLYYDPEEIKKMQKLGRVAPGRSLH